jgi:hypothetical protein
LSFSAQLLQSMGQVFGHSVIRWWNQSLWIRAYKQKADSGVHRCPLRVPINRRFEQVEPARIGLRSFECCLRLFSYGSEGCRLKDRHIRQDLTVEVDTGLAQAVHQAAVGHAIQTRTGVDTGNPQRTELTLALPAVTVGILTCLGNGLLGNTVNTTAGTVVTLGLLQNFFVTGTCRYTTLNSSHFSILLLNVGQHALNGWRIRGSHMSILTQLTQALGALLGQDMVAVTLTHLEATRGRLREALGRTSVGLNLRHLLFLSSPAVPGFNSRSRRASAWFRVAVVTTA